MSTELEPVTIPPPPLGRTAGHRPRSSRDKALTAFAQLGCLRLNAKRCVVTLFGSAKQYIIAEATQTLSLLSDALHGHGDELWFGNASIDREQGVSAGAINPDAYTAYDLDGSTFSAPALVVSDLSNHDTYKTRAYAGRGVNFYCGVPFQTDQGHVIGVYTVTDDKPRDGISATELRFLVDMSVIIMQHLEAVRNDRIRKRGQRLIHGIGGFIEGDVAEEIPPTAKAGPTLPSDPDVKSSHDAEPNKFPGMVITDANGPSENAKYAQPTTSDRPSRPLRMKSSDPDEPNSPEHGPKPPPASRKASTAKEKVLLESQQVFDRAAAILRYCLGSDGVLFFDASCANLGSGSRMESSGSIGRLHHFKKKEPRRSEQENETRQSQSARGTSAMKESSMSSDDSANSTRSQSDSCSSPKRKGQKCQILGRSVLESNVNVSIPEQSLRRFVRRHPKGKCFTFDQFGKPASSDESSGTASPNDVLKDGADATSHPEKYLPTTSALLRALPGARTIIFLPLWDFAKERWHSGLVVWSNDPGRLTNVEDNMIYLKAFNNAVMNEVNRTDLILSDAAKSTFLANISHELRSPLHGILGSIEFLHDTAMDDFQSSMVISVETCGKTLLDTVNHVLEYTKIHNLSRSLRHGKRVAQNYEQSRKPETSLTEDFDLSIVVEEAVEAVYAGQVFRSANADALEGKSPAQTAASRAMQQRQERRANISKGSATQRSPVCLTLNMDDHTDWRVRSQPGAIRRIVMNILGNALKYTSKGNINVSLEVNDSRSKTSPTRHLMLSITDTGQGMRNDFLKNHAFTAFSQENSLATGTGLGLSIVRQIVDSLGGKIDLSSEKDVGTEVRIWLSLPKSQKDLNADSDYNAVPPVREKTKGMEMCMLMPYDEKSTEDDVDSLITMPTIESSMRNLVAQWFRMKVTSTKTMDGRSPDFFVYPEPPPIDYLMDFHGNPDTDKEIPVIILCTNAFEAAALRSNGVHQLTDIGRVIEVIAQPCGPQKLAKVLHRCMQRLEMLEKGGHPNRKSSRNVPSSFSVDRPIEDRTQAESRQHKQGEESGQMAGPRQGDDTTELGTPAPKPPNDTPLQPHSPRSRRKSSSGDKSRPRKPSSATNGTSEDNGTVSHTNSTNSEDNPRVPESNRPRVLAVDDNPINLHLLVTFVRKSDHPYESATNGLQALEAYKKSIEDNQQNGRRPLKYILMDISMPVMNGITATKEIRKFEKEAGVKEPATIIALTGMGSDVAQDEAKEAGFDQFLGKPIKFKTLVKLLV